MKKTLLLTLLFLLFSSIAFAQFVGNDGISADLMLKFQWTRVKEGDDWITGPELEAAARLLFPGKGLLRTGLSGAVSISFPKQMEFTFPQFESTPLPDIGHPKPGDTYTFSWNDMDLFGISAFVGLTTQAPLVPGFITLVTDMGVIFGWDSASSENGYLYGGSRRLYLDLSNNFFGLGVGVGLQVALGSILVEAGVNLKYTFMQWSTVYLYTALPSEKSDSSKRDVLVDSSGNIEFSNVFRFGVPYIAAGYKFR